MKHETLKLKHGNGHFKANLYKSVYPSLEDFRAEISMKEWNKKAFSSQSSISGSKSFTMTQNYQEAETLMIQGWNEGAKQLTAKLKLAGAKPAPKEVMRAMHDVVGFQASVPRYLQGIPTNMVNKKKVVQKQKVVTLIKGITYNAGISASTILNDSVKFLQLVQAIEAEGIRVNVDVAFYSKAYSEHIFYRARIKKASERLNLSKMSFPLMHPSFLRRIMFRAMEVDERIQTTVFAHGYGSAGGVSEISPHLEKGEYYIPILINEKQMLDVMKEATKK